MDDVITKKIDSLLSLIERDREKYSEAFDKALRSGDNEALVNGDMEDSLATIGKALTEIRETILTMDLLRGGDAILAEPGYEKMFKLIGNDEQLEAELDEGEKHAMALVDHLQRMGAGGCSIPIIDRGDELVVVVMARREWEEKHLRDGQPNPFE